MSRLTAFAAVARLGNITMAAKALGLTQAAVSRQLRELEDQIGRPLAWRKQQGITLTPAGQRLMEILPDALDTICDAVEFISGKHDALGVTVFCDHSLTSSYLIPALTEFERLHDGTKTQILSSNQGIEEFEGQFDLAVFHGDTEFPNLKSQLIAPDFVFPVAAPSIADKWSEDFDISEIIGFPLLELAPRKNNWMTWEGFFRGFGEDYRVTPRAVFDSYAVAIEAARLGQGILLGWGLCIEGHLASGDLVPLGGWKLDAPGGLRVYYSKSRQTTPSTKKLIAWLSAKRMNQ